MASEKVAVYISRELYEKAKRFVEETGSFSSVEELVEFVLNEVVLSKEAATFSREDEEKVKERLRSLGYI